jgi:Protein of unknown function (DUF2804)
MMQSLRSGPGPAPRARLPAMQSLPVRGPAVRELGLPLPPDRMPLLRHGRPVKRWRYVGVYTPDVMLCAGEARVAGLPQRWWAVAFPDRRLLERTSLRSVGLELAQGRVAVARREVSIELELDEAGGVEVVSEHGGGYIWTRKQAGVGVRGSLAALGRTWELDGAVGFVDDSAGYHARHTTWRWSAGLGRARSGEHVAWNLVEGIHDSREASERTLWVDGDPHEVGPQPFAADLSSVGGLRFTPWCEREDHTNRWLFRSDYRQPFGAFAGELPGGLGLQSGHGVMEWHDVRW